LKNYYFGILAEYIVFILYVFRFHRFIALRYKTYLGEIDLIFKRKKTIIFVEVKARSTNIDDILCSKMQQERIKRAALLFLQKNPIYREYNFRFDLVIIRPYRFPEIIENAW
jgi:putative endonuclease